MPSQNPLRILIVEDDQIVSMDMEDMIRQLGYQAAESAGDYANAVRILADERPDLALLDINLGGDRDGVDLAEHIRTHYDIPIVFVTSHADKATVVRSGKTQPNGYLLKPFAKDNLFAAIETAIVNYQATRTPAAAQVKPDGCIMVKSNRQYVKVPVADVLWIESDLNYIHIHTAAGKHTVRMSFKELLSNFPENYFVQTHKSFMVVPKHIDAVATESVTINGTEIPLSRSFREDVLSLTNRIR
ncbi:MAG: two-component system-response regulator [Bacteroidetes bacterium]|nr:MAG: two-component system-response regulator [Bacteroidota bacterium]